MISKKTFFLALAVYLFTMAFSQTRCLGNEQSGIDPEGDNMKIVFLHHSTGERIWKGGMLQWFEKYNSDKGTDLLIEERIFPRQSPYGWNNYPYDYWNIWVNHAGNDPFMEEPTLEILAKEYDLIILKHCFPVSDIAADTGAPDIESQEKRAENYMLQYEALKKKMREFPETKFLLWTGPAEIECTSLKYKIVSFLKRRDICRENAERAKDFFDWVRNDWDEPDDNIFLWDFYALSTEGSLYIKGEYAENKSDPHPNRAFAEKAAPEFCRRIVDVLEGRGDSSSR